MIPRKKHALFDHLIAQGGVKNDAEIAQKLQMHPPNVSRVRAGLLPLGATPRLRVMKVFSMSLDQLDALCPPTENEGIPDVVEPKQRKPQRPHPLLDYLIKEFSVKNDFAIAKALQVNRSHVCRLRAGRAQLNATHSLKIMRTFGLSLEAIEVLCPPSQDPDALDDDMVVSRPPIAPQAGARAHSHGQAA